MYRVERLRDFPELSYTVTDHSTWFTCQWSSSHKLPSQQQQSPRVGLMSVHCLRRWPNSKKTLDPNLVLTALSWQQQNICITFVQRRPNVFDVGATLYKCYTNVLCLLGSPRVCHPLIQNSRVCLHLYQITSTGGNIQTPGVQLMLD